MCLASDNTSFITSVNIRAILNDIELQMLLSGKQLYSMGKKQTYSYGYKLNEKINIVGKDVNYGKNINEYISPDRIFRVERRESDY